MTDFPSGEWTGYYLQGRRFRQDLALTFKDGVMSGAGRDWICTFSIRGRYDEEKREAWWTKSYATHDVHYRGFRESTRGIWGTWTLQGGSSGGFHTWPVGEGEAQADDVAEEAEEPAPAAVSPHPVRRP